MWSRAGKKRGGGLDITPLVDMVFLLHIFFLLTFSFAIAPAIRIDLPDASSQKVQKEKKEITLSVDQSGVFYFNKDPVEPVALAAHLAASARDDSDTTVLIRGDKATGFGRVVELLDMVRQSGLRRIAIMTQKKTESTGGEGRPPEK